MKKACVLSSLGLLVLCNSAIAGALPGPSYLSTSTIPSLTPGLEISGSLLYLQPNTSNLDYAILTSPFPVPTPNWDIQEINPDYHAGFNVGLGYIFSDTDYDIKIDWSHLSAGDSDEVHANESEFVAPPYEVGPDAASIRQASAHVSYNYDSVNIDFGSYKEFANHLRARFFGGLNISSIKEDLSTTYSDDAPTFAVTSDNLGKFSGIGPRFGTEATYYLCNSFGIVGQAAVAALIGTQRTKTTFTSFSPELAAEGIVTNVQEITDENTTQVIPEIDAKLGVSYIYHPEGKSSALEFELGYQAAVYINAIKEVYPTSVVAPIQTGTVAVDTMGSSLSNFSVQGAYFRVAYKA